MVNSATINLGTGTNRWSWRLPGRSNWNAPHWRVIYYHGVDEHERGQFHEHLQWFAQNFRWCRVTEGMQAISFGNADAPLMSVTFDDADETLHRIALPVLAELGIRACVYVVPAYVVHGSSFRDPRPRRTMCWSQLREWLAAGHEIGSHTYTHANLPRCCFERMRQECLWSKEAIEDALGVPVNHFAYPWGQYSKATRQCMGELGCYQTAATTHRGRMTRGHDLLNLRRDRADLSRTGAELEHLMRSADRYYWLRRFRWQWIRARARGMLAKRWPAFSARLRHADDLPVQCGIQPYKSGC